MLLPWYFAVTTNLTPWQIEVIVELDPHLIKAPHQKTCRLSLSISNQQPGSNMASPAGLAKLQLWAQVSLLCFGLAYDLNPLGVPKKPFVYGLAASVILEMHFIGDPRLVLVLKNKRLKHVKWMAVAAIRLRTPSLFFYVQYRLTSMFGLLNSQSFVLKRFPKLFCPIKNELY